MRINFLTHASLQLWCLALILGLGLCLLEGLVGGSVAYANPEAKLEALVKKFEATAQDKKLSARRDAWLKLSEDFNALGSAKAEAVAAKAMFYDAKSLHELGQRSGRKDDFGKAVQKYDKLLEKYPASAFAPEALWFKIIIMDKRLGQQKEARELAAQFADKYPASPRVAEAKAFGAGKPVASSGQAKPASDKPVGGKPEPSMAEQLGLRIQTVMLDPGHGGKDPGAVGNSLQEKKITMDVVNRVGKILERKGLTVIYTRKKDVYITVQDRPMLANDKKVDLFVSVHVNANKTTSLRGLEVYYLDAASSDRAQAVAARENGVATSKVSNAQFILTDLTLNSKLTESKDLSQVVYKNIQAAVKGAKFQQPGNGVRSAPFYVLMGAKMPAILVETAYLTNANDAKLLKNEKFLQAQAEGIANGILAYKKKIESVKP